MRRIIIVQNVEREGPGLFLDLAREFNLEPLIYKPYNEIDLPTLKDSDLLLILGGPMGLRELNKYTWLKNELRLLEQAVYLKLPIIGVCFGAQLLAHIYGGSIVKLRDTNDESYLPEIGWHEIIPVCNSKSEIYNTTKSSPLEVLHWHEDRILLPSNALVLASSERCKEQLFRIDCNYGIQFHLEIKDDYINRWVEEDKDFIELGIGAEGVNKLISQHNKYFESSIQSRINLLIALFNKILI